MKNLRFVSTMVLVLTFCVACSSADSGELGPSQKARLIVENGIIITMEPGAEEEAYIGHLVVDQSGLLTHVDKGPPPAEIAADVVLDATNKIVMPGFVSGHAHFWQSPFRGLAPNDNLDGWVEAKREHTINYDKVAKGDMYYFTLNGVLDFMRHGVTTVYHFSQRMTHIPEFYEEQLLAELDAEQRFIFGYARPKNDPSTVQEVIEAIQAFQRVAEERAQGNNYLELSLVNLGLFWADETLIQQNLQIADALDLQVHSHYLENPDLETQIEQRENFMEILGKIQGPLNNLVFAHFIHTDDDILSLCAKKGMNMIWCALANGRLGDGLADIPKYLEKGLQVGMGLDGQGSSDIGDPFSNMRTGLYALRMKYEDASILSPYKVMQLHTIGTAEVLGVDDKVGSLEVGKFADILILNPSNPTFGPITKFYPISGTFVFACSSENIEGVYIGGKCVVDKGRMVNHDMQVILEQVRERIIRYGNPLW